MRITIPEYENFIYTIQYQFDSIRASTLVVKRTSATTAFISGFVYFGKDVVLRIFEAIDFITQRIEDYGYESLPRRRKTLLV